MASIATGPPATKLRSSTVLLAFAVFGLLWGMYAAALPEIKRNTAASDGDLGAALVCVGLAAAPAMFAVGRLLDRFGRPVAITCLCLFAVVAPLPTFAGSVPTLVVALLLFGFASGACDVVINSMGATVEAETGQRVLNRAHALFSVGLLVGTIVTSLARAREVAASEPMVVVAALTAVGALASARRLPARPAAHSQSTAPAPGGRRRIDPLVAGFGALAALALLVESGVQQWSAIFLEDVVGASAGLSGLAPGVFAGSMALGRFGGHWLSTRMTDRIVLLASGLLSALGVLVLAASAHPVVALVGFAVAGAAISVAAPTVYGLVGRSAPAHRRATAVGTTASLAYIGLLLGPVVVGMVADLTTLRTAIGSLVVVSLSVSLAALLVKTARGGAPG